MGRSKRIAMYRSPLALLVAAPLLAAPAPKGKEVELYYPTKEGATRVLEMTVSGSLAAKSRETQETVTKVEEKDGTYRVTIKQEWPGKNTKKNMTTVMEVSGKGVSRLASFGKDLPEPVVLLKLPARAGDTWTSGGSTTTIGKEEEIEVPAGKYKAVVVVNEMERDGSKVKTTAWFAVGVGMVKSVTTVNDIETTHVLKSFTPGK
jgi:hypothetical protein